jgi:hypothetical protein
LQVPGFEASTVKAGPVKWAKTGFAGGEGAVGIVATVAVVVAVAVAVAVVVAVAVAVAVVVEAMLALGAAEAVADGGGVAATVVEGVGAGSGLASSWHAVRAEQPSRAKRRRLTPAMIARRETLSALSTASP